MHDKKIEVIAYSGYKAEECPRAFFINGENIKVIDILRMWIEEGQKDSGRKRFFKIKGDDRYIHTLFYDEKAKGWFLG